MQTDQEAGVAPESKRSAGQALAQGAAKAVRLILTIIAARAHLTPRMRAMGRE